MENNKKGLKLGWLIKTLSLLSILSFVVPIYLLFGLNFHNLLGLILQILPFLLLTIYLFTINTSPKCAILFPIIFAILAINPILFMLFYNIIYCYYSFIFPVIEIVMLTIPSILTVIFSFVSNNKSIRNIIATITSICGIWYIIISLLCAYIIPVNKRFIIDAIPQISLLLLFITIIIYSINNEIPKVEITKKRTNFDVNYINNTQPEISAEQKLTMLKSQYEKGYIPEESYKEQRAEIIRRI